MYSTSIFSSSTTTNKPELGTVKLENINGIYVPLKQTDSNNGYKIENIEGMRDFDIKSFMNINQKIDQKTINELTDRNLILNDNIFSRIFIGGISFFGLYVLYNFLYKTKNN